MLVCNECNDSKWIRSGDDWAPCGCLVQLHLDRQLGSHIEISNLPDVPIAGSSIIVGVGTSVDRVRASIIHSMLLVDIEAMSMLVYSGEMAANFFTKVHDLNGLLAPELLFITLIKGETYPKMTGTVCNQIYELRAGEGLLTHFISPYGSNRLYNRYSKEESDFPDLLRSLKVIIANGV